MFDRNKPITLKLVSGGDKKVTCRFPTDPEQIAHARRLVRVTRLGGSTELRDFDQVQLDMANKLLVEGETIELSPGEAVYVVDKLLRADVVDAVREGAAYVITLRVVYGEVTHTLNVPTIDAARKYDKSVRKVAPKRNTVESYDALDGVAEFWKSCGGKAEGYAEGQDPPVVHMQAAIEEVIAQMNQAMDDVDPED